MTNNGVRMSVDFLTSGEKRLFTLFLEPDGSDVIGSVLFLHAFTEEMHKSRHMVALQARTLAAAGYNVLLLDLSGCGDSSGDFVDASWEGWLEDAEFALSWLSARSNQPVSLWGLRLGALLATELSQRLSDIRKLVLWQPVLNGEHQIDQFLRFQSTGLALKGEAGFDRAALWEALRSGQSLEVAGYELPARLALSTSRVRLSELRPNCEVIWLEVSGLPETKITIASENVIHKWQEQGVKVDQCCISGAPFWRNFDAPDNAVLLSTTLEALQS